MDMDTDLDTDLVTQPLENEGQIHDKSDEEEPRGTVAPPPSVGEEEKLPDENYKENQLLLKKRHRKQRLQHEEQGDQTKDGDDEDVDWSSSDESWSSEWSEDDHLGPVLFRWGSRTFQFQEVINPNTIDGIFNKTAAEEQFDESGRKRYLFVCRALQLAPCSRFYRGLLQNKIDLSFLGINAKSVRGMCCALVSNTKVKEWILRDNWLSKEACYHIGLMLSKNSILTHLSLEGCRVGPEGVMNMCGGLVENGVLKVLNLSRCCLGDEGLKILGPILEENKGIKEIYLSYNSLSTEAAIALGSVLTLSENIAVMDLSWNELCDPVGMTVFCKSLGDNKVISKLILSWNAISSEENAQSLSNSLRKNQSLQYLDLSDNRLQGSALKALRKGVVASKSLQVILLGNNPMSPDDAENFVSGLAKTKQLKIVDLEDIWVSKSFNKTLAKVQQAKDIQINIGGIYSGYELKGCDYAKLIMNRAQYEAEKPKQKKLKRDFGHLIWTIGEVPVTQEVFMEEVQKFDAKIEPELFPELLKLFKTPHNEIDMWAMKSKYLSLFPNSKPPEVKKKKAKEKEGEAQEEDRLSAQRTSSRLTKRTSSAAERTASRLAKTTSTADRTPSGLTKGTPSAIGRTASGLVKGSSSTAQRTTSKLVKGSPSTAEKSSSSTAAQSPFAAKRIASNLIKGSSSTSQRTISKLVKTTSSTAERTTSRLVRVAASIAAHDLPNATIQELPEQVVVEA